LRGVRGERVLIRSHEVSLQRPVQLLHPRVPLYIVPWGDGLFMIGATLIETEDTGPVSVRSALELLGGAYAVHPAFAEAEILDLGVGVRPAFPDNMPRAVVRNGGRRIFVNGAYRHGFLLAPVLGRAVADYIESGKGSALLTTGEP
jgi:glycine oxidase